MAIWSVMPPLQVSVCPVSYNMVYKDRKLIPTSVYKLKYDINGVSANLEGLTASEIEASIEHIHNIRYHGVYNYDTLADDPRNWVEVDYLAWYVVGKSKRYVVLPTTTRPHLQQQQQPHHLCCNLNMSIKSKRVLLNEVGLVYC